MKRTFVLRVGPETGPETGRFTGHAEDVETGAEVTFQSTYELFAFLNRCLRTGEQKAVVPKTEPLSGAEQK